MSGLVRLTALPTAVRATSTLQAPRPTNTIGRAAHNYSLASLHQTPHTTTETAPQLHGLRLHDHQTHQAPIPNPISHTVSPASLHQTLHQAAESAPQLHGLRFHDHHAYQNQTETSSSKVQKSNISTSIKESKIAKELREARGREAACGGIDFDEVHSRARILRNLGIWEVPVGGVNKIQTQVIMSDVIASTVLPKEKMVKIEAKSNSIERRGVNPILSRVRLENKTLCAADLDNIYNL
ncbi:hypothetical protein N431DRAFT_444435 [Stipitochalara longipes BDJ]|nr:hypothetical protein N431DRAFT_444435 [Stipitochalara longipes BDJ]